MDTPKEDQAKTASAEGTDAQPEVSQDEAALVRTASISGSVRDAQHSPVEGALVQLEFDDEKTARYEATTNADGHYEISGIAVEDEAGVLTYASAEGFVMRRESYDVSPGVQLTDKDFTLEAARFVVAGRVVTSGQRSIEGARVGTMHYGYGDDGIAQMEQSGGSAGRGNISSYDFVFDFTDATGAFLMTVPHEGNCDIFVTADGYGPAYYPAVAYRHGKTPSLCCLRAVASRAG